MRETQVKKFEFSDESAELPKTVEERRVKLAKLLKKKEAPHKESIYEETTDEFRADLKSMMERF